MKKVIVLDDNHDILEAVLLVLKRITKDVVALDQPALLERCIPVDQPSVLLMDIFMGNYDGRKICRLLKDNPLFSQLSIVLFSAQTYTYESVEESGADAILNKPFSMQTLTNVMGKFLNS